MTGRMKAIMAADPAPAPLLDTPARRTSLRTAGSFASAWSWWIESDRPSREAVAAEIEGLVAELRRRDDAARQAAERRSRR